MIQFKKLEDEQKCHRHGFCLIVGFEMKRDYCGFKIGDCNRFFPRFNLIMFMPV